MGRKTIGFFAGGSDHEYNGKISNGIHDMCRDYDVNLLGFTSLYNNPPAAQKRLVSQSVYDGEKQIFELADFENLDGMIILGDMFMDHSIQDSLVARGVTHKIPTVVIDGMEDSCYNIVYKDDIGMENVVRHVIEFHKCTRINFISGYKNNRQSEERFAAFLKVLEENHLDFDERRLGYGQFGGRTREVMAEFFQSELEFPEAIVCANDAMAIEAINYLSEMGISVPEQVIVTGFDGILTGQTYFPALTSLRRAMYEAGQEAVEILHRVWNGVEVPALTQLQSILIKNQSCGCRKTGKLDVSEYYKLQKAIVDNYDAFNYDLVSMTNEISRAQSIEEIFSCVFRYTTLHNRDVIYFCMNDKLIKNTEDITQLIPLEDTAGYTDIMTAYFINEEHNVTSERYPGWLLEPNACKDNKEYAFTYFIPMYFQERTLGYVIYKMNEYERYSTLLYTLIRTVSNAIGDFCMKNEMESMMQKLEYINVRDPLTSLYNRRGLRQGSDILIDTRKDSDELAIGIGIDLDRLKMINDTYGHEEGDNAIVQVANAIRYAKQGNEICSRVGGDEFFIFGTYKDSAKTEEFIKRVHKFLHDYNNASGKAYLVECSCGAYTAPISKVKSFEIIMNMADQVMYAEKVKKKTNR